MSRYVLTALAALSALPACGVLAGGTEPNGLPAAPVEDPDCGGNTLQMVQCANRVFERADRELNLVWQENISALEREDRTLDDHREPRADIARTGQKAWQAFRDAQCAVEADDEARGGSMYPLIYIACRTDMTRVRIQQLQPDLGK